MMTYPWRYAFASVVGTSHSKLDIPCQDASDCRVLRTMSGERVLVAVVSDGAGSAECSEQGAQLACSLFISELASLFESGSEIQDINCDFSISWLKRYQSEISMRAEAGERTSRDFACTVLAAAIGLDYGILFQVGDGAIVVSSADEPEEYNWTFWPQHGAFVNTTIFATDADALERIECVRIERKIDEIAMFSDGLERLALHFQSQTAHAPFFRPMFASLRQISEEYSDQFSQFLASFLSSSQVNDRTDDDKTLILATRREIAK